MINNKNYVQSEFKQNKKFEILLVIIWLVKIQEMDIKYNLFCKRINMR